MASPVGHMAVGLATAATVARVTGTPDSASLWLGALIAAMIPDVDVPPHLLGWIGRRGHRNATHSLSFAAAVIVVGLALIRWRDPTIAPGLLLAWVGALLSHPFLDVLATGPTLGRLGWGIPLLWPFSRRRFYVSRPLLVSDRGESHTVWDTLREAREDTLRIVPGCVLVVLLAELWR